MSDQKYPFSRRQFLATTALGAAAAATGTVAMPSVLRAQGAGVKLGVLHPVTGALSYSGQQGRLGATMAIEEINAAGGIKGLGKIDAVLGDAQSTPEGGTAEVEKMNSAGVACIVGGYASNICLATTQAAARYELPYVVDVGVADGIVTRGLKNTFRFGPGFGVIAKTALANLAAINDAGRQAGQDRHDRARGFAVRLRSRQAAQRAAAGAGLPDTGDHPASDADARLQQRRAQDQGAEPGYRHSGELLQRIRPARAHHAAAARAGRRASIRCSAARRPPTSSSRNSPRPPSTSWTAITGSIRKNPKAQALKKKVEAKGQFFTYEVYMNYSCVLLIADALQRAASADRAKLTAALASSTFAGHVMPYGPTKFVNGQNEGAAPVNTQVLDNDIKVILPPAFANAKPVFPMPA